MGATSSNIELTSSDFDYRRSRCVIRKPCRSAFRSGSYMARQELPRNSRRHSQCARAVGSLSLSFVHEDLDPQPRRLLLALVLTQSSSGAG